MNLILIRHAFLPDCTLGRLYLLEGMRLILPTIERPWIKNPDGQGGWPRESCIPDGNYDLTAHDSLRHPDTYALTNESLGVYAHALPAHQSWGRTAILIHPANRASELLGCIAVGLAHGKMFDKDAVVDSQAAMGKLRAALGREGKHLLTLRPTLGTEESIL